MTWTKAKAIEVYGEDKRGWLENPVSHHFQRWEIVCRCGCGLDTLYPLQLVNLDNLRKAINRKLTITSGCRCVNQNARVGGEINSMHLPDERGMTHATDIIVPDDITFREMEEAMEEIWVFGGIGKYTQRGFMHWDDGLNRANFRRWND